MGTEDFPSPLRVREWFWGLGRCSEIAGRHASRDKGLVPTCPIQGHSCIPECGVERECKVQTVKRGTVGSSRKDL